jgi:Zn-dependent protease
MADLSLNIGRLFGVPIELHWTFILLMLFILLVSSSLFVLWVLLFVFVLLHELSHSWMAKRHGVGVKRIVLFPLGGGTIINSEQLTPKKEFIISISGPIASLAIALALWLVSVIVGSASAAGQFLNLLALINLVLGVFNILPWLPLDGGKALRSYLQEKMSYLNATRLAVRCSNIVTALFILASVIYAFLNPAYSLSYRAEFIFFSVAVAVFVYFGAANELSYALVKQSIKGLKVRDALSRNYKLVSADTTIAELRSAWERRKGRKETEHIIIFKNGKKVSALSAAYIQRYMPKRKSDAKVREFGIDVPTIAANARLSDAIDIMAEENAGMLCAIKNGRPAGILLRQKIDYIIGLHLRANGKDIKQSEPNNLDDR